MKNAALSVLILTLAAVGACNRTADRAPSSSPQASTSGVPPSVNQPSSSSVQPSAPSGPGTSQVPEPPSKELSKQDESTGGPRPGTGGADHSTPAREPGAKG
jgi:hypothetical protein